MSNVQNSATARTGNAATNVKMETELLGIKITTSYICSVIIVVVRNLLFCFFSVFVNDSL